MKEVSALRSGVTFGRRHTRSTHFPKNSVGNVDMRACRHLWKGRRRKRGRKEGRKEGMKEERHYWGGRALVCVVCGGRRAIFM